MILWHTRCKHVMGIHCRTWLLTSEEALEPSRLLREAVRRRGLQEEGVFDVCEILGRVESSVPGGLSVCCVRLTSHWRSHLRRITALDSLEARGRDKASYHILGVCDFVADTDFPDICTQCGSLECRPGDGDSQRTQIATGKFLTRLYVWYPADLPRLLTMSCITYSTFQIKLVCCVQLYLDPICNLAA